MSSLIFKNARVIDPAQNIDCVSDVATMDGVIVEPSQAKEAQVIDLQGLVLTPGFIDLHVHLRQPGATDAETVATGGAAAVAGGFTSIVAMPNTKPSTDTVAAVELLRNVAQKSPARVLPCGCLTVGRAGEAMTGIGSLKEAGVMALSDDGNCVQNHALMRHIVQYAKSFNLPILDHCEEKTLAANGVMHEGKWSVLLGINGIPRAAEDLMVARDILLAQETNWKLHIQHVSSKNSIDMLRMARRNGVPISGEATPHHLTLTDECLKKFDTNYKMNPPLRSEEDRQALIAAVADGTITVIATDHAPHTETAKQVELDRAPFGIIGLETAFPLCYTELVKKGVIALPHLIRLFTLGPAEVLGKENYGLFAGNPADFTIFDPNEKYVIDASKFKSKSRNTPFNGFKVTGRIKMTVVGGKVVYSL